MKNKYMGMLMLFIFLSFTISYDAQGVSLQDIILQEEIAEFEFYNESTEVNELNNDLDYDEFHNRNILDYDKYILQLEKIYYCFYQYYDIYNENTEGINEELLNKKLSILNNFINYLDNNFYLQDLINDEIKEKFEFLNEGEIINFTEIKNILENVISYYKNNKEDDNISNTFEENKEFEEIYAIDNQMNKVTKDEDNYYQSDMYIKNMYDLDQYRDIDENEEEMLLKTNLLQNIINSRNIENNSEEFFEEELDIPEINVQDNEKSEDENYKVNILDLKVTEETDGLKITFKIDNDLDLKKENNDLKIYIANTSNKEILVIKDKSLDNYLSLDNITSLSGEILKLGKNDILLEGVYTVLLSQSEKEKLNTIGLDNLVVKVEAIFNNKSNSAIGYLKKNADLSNEDNEDTKVKISEELNSIATNTTNEHHEENENSDREMLPKTGVFLGNYLLTLGGFLVFLLGAFLVKYKKIGN